MIPIREARLEWNKGGPFRVSHYADESPDWTLRMSGGACFKLWQEMPASDEPLLMAWFFHHIIAAVADGCDIEQMFQETAKVGLLLDVSRLALDPEYYVELTTQRKEVAS